MPKYIVYHNDSEWEIEALNYMDAHFEVLRQENYIIELAPEPEPELEPENNIRK